MSEINTDNLVEITDDIEFIYVTIPKEYLCVYHKILVLLAEYGIDMLKDCKASCTDRNSNVIECFNMFNAAVAAHKLGQDSLANTLIVYVKAKIEQITNGKIDDTTFVFPIDENNEVRAFIECKDSVKIYVDESQSSIFTNN